MGNPKHRDVRVIEENRPEAICMEKLLFPDTE